MDISTGIIAGGLVEFVARLGQMGVLAAHRWSQDYGFGTHAELMASNGAYTDLHNLQANSYR